jgi:hypothetical protein
MFLIKSNNNSSCYRAKPNPRNQLTPNAPTMIMITRSTKKQGQEENTLSNNMVKTND